MDKYILMHKDIQCASFELDETKEHIFNIKTITPEHLPFLGNFDLKNANHWWKYRTIASKRKDLKELLHKLKLSNQSEFMLNNLALSLSDCYWVKPFKIDYSWKDINLYEKKLSGISLSSKNKFSADSTLCGQMKKKWILHNNEVCLRKDATVSFGQQNINELIATKFHQKQGVSNDYYIPYELIYDEDGNCIASICPQITNPDLEMIPAYEIVMSKKHANSINEYDFFIKTCVENGLDKNKITSQLEYYLQSDFCLDNTDRHLNNLSILRDSNTLQFIAISPIYDTGNSMYWDSSEILSPKAHLEKKLNSFFSDYGKLMNHMKNKNVIDENKLLSSNEIREILISNKVASERVQVIITNYEERIKLFNDFKLGKRLNPYYYRNKEKPIINTIKSNKKKKL